MKHNTQRTLLLKVSSLILGLSLSALAMNASANTEEATVPTAEAPTATAPSAEANAPATAAAPTDATAIQQLKKHRTELQTNYKQQLQIYKPTYPAMIQLKQEITDIEKQLKIESEKSIVDSKSNVPATVAPVNVPAKAAPTPTTTAGASTEAAPVTAKPAPASPIASMSEIASSAPPMSDIKFTGVSSLRGEYNINAGNTAGDIKIHPADRAPIARNYFQQPPLIPHRVREYKITVRNNKCMSCHSWKNYKKARATKVSQTHFADRDGNAQSTLAARRYFCNQCHVPQVDAKPLVENSFKPVSELNK